MINSVKKELKTMILLAECVVNTADGQKHFNHIDGFIQTDRSAIIMIKQGKHGDDVELLEVCLKNIPRLSNTIQRFFIFSDFGVRHSHSQQYLS